MHNLDDYLKTLVEDSSLQSYSCLMLDIPNQFTAKILAEISDEDLHKYGKELDAHVTVKYGLHTSNPKDVFDVCENWGKFPIHVTVDNFSLFRNCLLYTSDAADE